MVEGPPMTLHLALPLVALLLNVALIAIALAGGGRRPVDRVFAVFASSMVLWNGGVFWLRAAATADEAFFAEVVIHMGVIGSEETVGMLLSYANKIEVSAFQPERLKLSIKVPTGVMSGSFLDSGKTRKLNGVIFQKQNLGSGFFLGASESGLFARVSGR
jgi:hypothetical protein